MAFFILVTVVDQMVLGPVSCLGQIHCTAVFALPNSKFSCLHILMHQKLICHLHCFPLNVSERSLGALFLVPLPESELKSPKAMKLLQMFCKCSHFDYT